MIAPAVEDVTAEVNRIRRDAGAPPLKRMPHGQRSDPYSCPLAIALFPCGVVGVTGFNAWLNEFKTVPLSNLLADFVEAFDRGEYPELVA